MLKMILVSNLAFHFDFSVRLKVSETHLHSSNLYVQVLSETGIETKQLNSKQYWVELSSQPFSLFVRKVILSVAFSSTCKFFSRDHYFLAQFLLKLQRCSECSLSFLKCLSVPPRSDFLCCDQLFKQICYGVRFCL